MRRSQPRTKLISALTMLISSIILLSACAFGASPVSTPAPSASTAESTIAGSTPAPAPSDAVPASTADSSTAAVTITFAAFEEERARYTPLIAAFERDNPTIHVQFVSLDALFRAGEPPEPERAVMSAADTTSFPMSPAVIAKGWARDLRPLMDADTSFDRADFYPGALEAASRDGHIYLLPRTLNLPLLFYNKDLWAKRGLPEPNPDWTWSDVLAAAEQLAQKRNDTVEVYGLLDLQAETALYDALIKSGVKPDQQTLRHDDPQVVAAVEHVAALITSGALLSFGAPGLEIGPDAEQQFETLIRNQQITMWSPALGVTPSLTPPPAFAVGVAPLPTPAISYFGGGDSLTMSSGTQHPDAAWRWLAFLSREEGTNPVEHLAGASAVPARKSVAARSRFWENLDAEGAAALKASLAQRARVQVDVSPTLLNPSLDLELLQAAWMAALQGEQTVSQALRDAQRERDQNPLPPTPTPDTQPIIVATPQLEAQQDAVRITFGAPGLAADQTRRLADAFNASNLGIFVEVKDVSSPRTYIAADAASLPLAQVAATTDCFTTSELPDQTTLTATLDLQPLIAADSDFSLDDYPAALLAPFKQGAELHGLPYKVYLRTLNYNVTAFDAAGIAHPSAAWTLDDLLQTAQQLTQGTGKDKQYGFAATAAQVRDLFFFVDRLGASTTTSSGELQQPNFTDPKLIQAIRTYLDLLRNASPHQRLQGYIQNDMTDVAYGMMTTGQVGMWLDYGPTFIDPGAEPGLKRVTRAIAPPPLAGVITPNDFLVRGLYISARTQQAEACWTWLKHLSNDLSGIGAGFPARTSLAESDVFTSSAAPGSTEVYKAYRVALAGTPSPNLASEQSARSQLDYFWFYRAVDRALQGKDLERELADAQTLTGQYLACVRGGTAGRACATQVDPDYQGRQNSAPESR